MAVTVTASLNVSLSASATSSGAQNSIVDSIQAAQGGLAAITSNLANGTGGGKAQYLWHQQRTVGAGVNDDIDLTALNTAIHGNFAFALVKWAILRLVTPATGARLVVGNAAANPWQAWFGAATSTEEVRSKLIKENQIDGWTVSGTSKILRVNNPGAASVVYDLILLGE